MVQFSGGRSTTVQQLNESFKLWNFWSNILVVTVIVVGAILYYAQYKTAEKAIFRDKAKEELADARDRAQAIQLASAEENIATAQAQAAKANAKAAEINLKLGEESRKRSEAELALENIKKQTGARFLNRDIFLGELNGFPKGHVNILFIDDDQDSIWLARSLYRLLKEAKWEVKEPTILPNDSKYPLDAPTGLKFISGGTVPPAGEIFPGMFKTRGKISGVYVVANKLPNGIDTTSPVYILHKAINACLLGGVGQALDSSLPVDMIKIVVRPKTW